MIEFLRETKRYSLEQSVFCPSSVQSRGKVYQSRIEDVDELGGHIKAAWEELNQRIIDTAVRQWRTRLHACVKAKGGHFEHKLP